MRSLPLRAQIYIYFLLGAVLILAAAAIHTIHDDVTLKLATNPHFKPFELLLQIIIFIGAICIADLYPIVLPYGENTEATVSGALKGAVAILLGPHYMIVVTLLGTLLAEILLRRVWFKAAFNVSEMTMASTGMSLVYTVVARLSGPDADITNPFLSFYTGLALVAMTLAFFVLNWGFHTMIISMTTGIDFWYLWKINLSTLSLNYLTVIPLGAVVARLWVPPYWSVLALVLPLIVIRQSLEFICALQRQTHEALLKMADAIDQRDPSTFQHSQRVATVSATIAEEMGLPAEDIETVRMAGRLHDLGKIGMSNTLLYKPGRFDDRERSEFQRHPAIGAELVSGFHLFRQGRNLIMHHHERFDGKGYPQGLAGEEIPLGSRIMAVADSFDAMVSQRVYTAPLSWEQALEELVRNKGTQFDPDVVDAFLRTVGNQEDKLPCYVDQMRIAVLET